MEIKQSLLITLPIVFIVLMVLFMPQITGRRDQVPQPVSPRLTEEQALQIARQSRDCTMVGIPKNDAQYNSNSQTWGINLERISELEKDGCHPACVVSDQTQATEVNWRCFGSQQQPENQPSVYCRPEQRNNQICNKIYQPVCAQVNVQCIKAPCDPIQQTFSNPCMACANPLVESYQPGECQ